MMDKYEVKFLGTIWDLKFPIIMLFGLCCLYLFFFGLFMISTFAFAKFGLWNVVLVPLWFVILFKINYLREVVGRIF